MDDRGAITLTSGSDGDHELTTWQRLPLPLGKVFDFFSDATNLGSLTPASLRFRLATSVPIEMRAGATIDYRLRVRGFPVRWQSEISGWEPPHRFVDVQRRGPYRLCRHEHAFREDDDGTVVFDHVRYRAPRRPTGQPAGRWERPRVGSFATDRIASESCFATRAWAARTPSLLRTPAL